MLKYLKEKLPMKKLSILALLAVSMSVVACQPKKENKEPDDSLKDDEVQVRLPANMNENVDGYDVRLRFDDAFFKEDAKNFNQELALLSLGNTFTTASADLIEAFYGRLQFDTNIKYTGYVDDPTEDSIGYSFAHKKIDDSDLIAISIRGFNYGKEWSNNFLVGETGNHEGFQARSNEIYSDLKNEIEFHNYQNVKLWITGYSRGGGISNVLSHQILSSNEIDVAQEDMYVYTFEAPRGLSEENAVAYPNVHNIINNADLVTYLAPEQYGLYRCGVDVQIYSASSNLSRLLYDFDKDIVLPEFTPNANYANEQECIAWMINEITKELDTSDPDNAASTAHTRVDYVNNYQTGIRYMMGLFFSLNSSTTNKIMENLNGLDATGMFMLLGDDGIYNFLKPILDEDNVNYNDEDLKANCAVMTKFLRNNLVLLMGTLMDNSGMDNLKRILYMHAPEAEYVLLKDLKIY